MQSVLDALDGFGGVYLALFVIAIVSGVFPLTNSEAALIAIGAGSSYSWQKLVLLAVIVALGQSITHASLYFSARGLANAGAKRRPRLEAKIAKAHELAQRWHKSEVLLMVLGATIGIPPQALVAIVAGVVGIRFRTFAAIDVSGRIARFTTIVLVAHLAA
ncbi:MAG TPA: VTT domain-containing protein [Kofleriaceae bacterium]|nr:VTT domain-containing protein [Kofleriaceae bacterium]